jgi:hypothetical protein
LAICSAPLTDDSGVFALVKVWREVLDRWPRARLWLLGEGTDGPMLYHRVRQYEMDHAVIFPGQFDEIRDVLEAADAFIIPPGTATTDWFWAIAMETGLPVICPASHPAATRAAMVMDDDPQSLLRSLFGWCESLHNARPGTYPFERSGYSVIREIVARCEAACRQLLAR